MTDDADLIERTRAALENLSDSPWLPDLTGDLVKMGWRALYQEAGLSSANYGTSRVISKSALSHRNVAGHLSTSSTVEVLDESLAAYYEDAGIEFYSAREIADTNLLSSLENAISLIERVPSLHSTVVALIRSLHLIKPEDDDYDVSFSEPHIPFSIFVSVPQNRSQIDGLRIAEAIVHEAMHLQLTLIEGVVPLVIKTSKKTFSPWRAEYRHLRGVLHALYVFRVIDQFLECLLYNQSGPVERSRYLQRRCAEIDEQIRRVWSFERCSELTRVGACFVQKLIQY